MINVFQVGPVVTGNSFIGRKELVNQYRKQFLNKNKSSSVSLIGITRIGKTSFIKKVFEKIPDYLIYSYSDLKESSNYVELWQSILFPIQEYLENNNLITNEILNSFSALEDESIPWIKLRSNLKKIFLYLGEKQLKTIVVLDEFDYATELFSSETKKYELFRSIISSPDYNIAAILISRRNLHDIEGQTFQSSTFRGVFDTRYFKGFNKEDLYEYYKIFNCKNIVLSESQKQKIEYYAGNSPYLLSILGNRIIDNRKNRKDIQISEIFLNDCRQINDYYADILKHLTRDKTRDKLISFVLGPNIGITRADRDELINLGYLREVDDEYIPISKFFEDYLRNNKLQESIWDKIISTEKKVKIILEKEKQELINSLAIVETENMAIELAILKLTPEIDQKDVQRYNSFIRANKRDFNVISSYFDVMSLSDCFKILKNSWLVFCKYFNDDVITKWEYKFSQIGLARNPPAHAHEEYLSDSIKIEVDSYCNDIQKSISKIVPSTAKVSKQQDAVISCELNKDNSKTENEHIKKNGVIVYKFAKCKTQKFVRDSSSNKEFFIHPAYSNEFENLFDTDSVYFNLKEFVDPQDDSKKMNFAVNVEKKKSNEVRAV